MDADERNDLAWNRMRRRAGTFCPPENDDEFDDESDDKFPPYNVEAYVALVRESSRLEAMSIYDLRAELSRLRAAAWAIAFSPIGSAKYSRLMAEANKVAAEIHRRQGAARSIGPRAIFAGAFR